MQSWKAPATLAWALTTLARLVACDLASWILTQGQALAGLCQVELLMVARSHSQTSPSWAQLRQLSLLPVRIRHRMAELRQLLPLSGRIRHRGARLRQLPLLSGIRFRCRRRHREEVESLMGVQPHNETLPRVAILRRALPHLLACHHLSRWWREADRSLANRSLPAPLALAHKTPIDYPILEGQAQPLSQLDPV